jgi:hypothetical protein
MPSTLNCYTEMQYATPFKLHLKLLYNNAVSYGSVNVT